MTTKFTSLLAVSCLFFLANTASAQQPDAGKVASVQKTYDSIKVSDGTVVPKNRVYIIESSAGKTIATYKAGQKVQLGGSAVSASGKKVVDCVQIECPGTFKPGTICWKCKARPANDKVKAAID